MSTPSSVRTKQHFDEYMAFLPDIFKAEECVRAAVDSLISYLYELADDVCWRQDGPKTKRLGFRDEPINWGDLSCCDVEKFADGSFLVTIDEASPECPNFCEWIRARLQKWGWEAKVQTEW